jgi:DtxR family transcriptional regulator, Mn-dependent transcriptional regulator
MNANANHERDECLERLWHRRELGGGVGADAAGDDCLRTLAAEGLVEAAGDGGIRFSPEGERRARQLVRSHRLAERLMQDVLGEAAEPSACEFEHLLGTEVVDAICTLLGHPRECPHGNPIPAGECCARSDRVVLRQVKPLVEMELGSKGRIAWVYAKSDAQLHALGSLQLRPGAMVTLHQRRPSYVVECEGAHLALDDALAGAVNVWAADAPQEPEGGTGTSVPGRHRRGRGKA